MTLNRFSRSCPIEQRLSDALIITKLSFRCFYYGRKKQLFLKGALCEAIKQSIQAI